MQLCLPDHLPLVLFRGACQVRRWFYGNMSMKKVIYMFESAKKPLPNQFLLIFDEVTCLCCCHCFADGLSVLFSLLNRGDRHWTGSERRIPLGNHRP